MSPVKAMSTPGNCRGVEKRRKEAAEKLRAAGMKLNIICLLLASYSLSVMAVS